jgi:hypothetical protein
MILLNTNLFYKVGVMVYRSVVLVGEGKDEDVHVLN